MDKPDPAAVPVATAPLTELIWHDVTQWGVEGRAWPEQQRLRYFDRLPAARCEFGYRDSVFKREPDRRIVTAIELLLPKAGAAPCPAPAEVTQ